MTTSSIGAVMLCDDIRQEINGKHILIGVYSGNQIIVPAMPFTIPISIWIEYFPESTGKTAFHLRISYSTGFQITLRVDAKIDELGDMGIATPPVVVQGAADGFLTVEYSDDGSGWTEIKRKEVRRGMIGTQGKSFAAAPTS
jgi:hypothetical protein